MFAAAEDVPIKFFLLYSKFILLAKNQTHDYPSSRPNSHRNFLLRSSLLNFTILPLPLKNPAIGPTILPFPMFQPVLILPLICLQQFVILIVPIAFATSRHLACFPTALVFVIYANQRTKTFHQIVLEGTFINTAIAVLNSAFTVPCILVELAFIDRSVFIACFSLAG